MLGKRCHCIVRDFCEGCVYGRLPAASEVLRACQSAVPEQVSPGVLNCSGGARKLSEVTLFSGAAVSPECSMPSEDKPASLASKASMQPRWCFR